MAKKNRDNMDKLLGDIGALDLSQGVISSDNSDTETLQNELAKKERQIEHLQQQLEGATSGTITPVDGKWQFGNFSLTQIGIATLGEVTEEDADTLVRALLKIETAIQFWLGDMVSFWIPDTNDNQALGKAYETFAERFGVENVTTLRDYAYVCRSVPLSVRTDDLKFSHHKLVAGLKHEDGSPDVEAQRYWLKQASENNWSVSALRDAMREDSKPSKATVFDNWFKHGVKNLATDYGKMKAHERKKIAAQIYDIIKADLD